MIRPERKSTFNVYDPIGLRYIFQLRLSLSPLRDHKYHYGFIDTPSNKCMCNQGVEDTKHFLFYCPLYVIQRTTLQTNISIILRKYMLNVLINNLKLHLYGHKSLSFDDNRNVILSTITFIKDSRRFSK